MLPGGVVTSSGHRLLGITVMASLFGGLAFLYSCFGFVSNHVAPSFDTFGSLTPQEIGGHFLFGYMISLPTRNLKIGLLAGLMALTLDADHVLNAVGFHIQGRVSHSIIFAILASILIGVVARQIFSENWLGNKITTAKLAMSSRNIEEVNIVDHYDPHNLLTKRKIFFQFLIISLAAYISHIAYDVFVDNRASFPLLAPFDFNDFLIPQIYALPIEGAAILLVYFCLANKHLPTKLLSRNI